MLNEIKEKFNDLTEGNNSNQERSSSNYGSTSSSARYGSSQGHGNRNLSHSDSDDNYSRYGSSSHSYGSTPRYRSSSDYTSSDYGSSSRSSSYDSGSGKVWIAALAGVGAGLVAGMLLAPETGRDTRDNLMRSMGNWGDEIDRTVKSVFGKAEDQGATGTGSSLQMKGNWNDIKGNLKQQYAQLTDDDLNYTEGNADEFVGNLQRKLGKTKREVYDLLGIDNNNNNNNNSI
jgi:uncharacterized protein YjbJ (UPF0337 family)